MSSLRQRRDHRESTRDRAYYDRIADRHEAEKARAKERVTRPARAQLRQVGERTNFADHQRAACRAADGGGIILKPNQIRWQISGKCQAPVTVDRFKRAGSRILTIEYEVRCRKCSWCMSQRQKYWALRARQEIALCPGRTWFGTFTLRPSERLRVLSLARKRCRHNGIDYDAQDPPTKFGDLVREINPLVTLWLKRVRKQVDTRKKGATLRYLIVVETHKDGFPHWHLLVHESEENAVLHADLRDNWVHGFSHFRLADREDNRTAYYVCKYLSKTMCARVRASSFYGKSS